VSHILGRKGFWKILVNVNRDVLTPRPDSEVIVDLVLKSIPEGRAFSILDLGVGSGAIILAILAERPAARGVGIELSPEALAIARDNAANLGLEDRLVLLRGDWTAGLADESFEVVVANPPYIRSGEIETLEPEVKDYEPRLALDGGADGLEAYRVLAPQVLRVLKPGGAFHIEIGHDQAGDVETLFREAGAGEVGTTRDLADKDRVVSGVKKPLGN
jgi:release factor glutamine methyltransferase